MKYLVMLCDGMADEPNEALGNSTPMEKANKPCMNSLAAKAEVGIVKTVAEGLKPGSDVATFRFSVMNLPYITAVVLRLRLQASVLI